MACPHMALCKCDHRGAAAWGMAHGSRISCGLNRRDGTCAHPLSMIFITMACRLLDCGIGPLAGREHQGNHADTAMHGLARLRRIE